MTPIVRVSAVWLVLSAVAAAPRASDGPPLTAAERRLVAAVDARVPVGLALLERAVNMNSGTMHIEGVRATGRLFQAEFDRLGFRTRWADGAAWDRAGHLVATRPGRRGAIRLLLIGHLDTVFEPDSPFQRFQRLDDSTARGPGVMDMKGGDVIMLLALEALAGARLLDAYDVTVVLTGDEEKAGAPRARARADLIDAARGADVAIGFEDGAGDPRTAVIARRSAGSWLLRTRGTPAHSSQIFKPDVGSGAIYEAARILRAFHDSLGGEPYLTANPGVVVGGTAIAYDPAQARGTASGKTNVVAESTTVHGDLRALTREQRTRAQEVMRRIVDAHLPHTSGEIAFVDDYPPMAPTDGNRRLLARYDRASRDLGFGPVEAVDPGRAGAADISFVAGSVGMALDGVGMMGTGGHTVLETADLRTLPMQAKRMALMLARLAREGRQALSAR